MDFLKSAVASAIAKSSSFPYLLHDEVESDNLRPSIWSLFNATKKDDNSTCSIFTFDITTKRRYLPLAKNAARKLRTLRHPGVVRVVDTIETETSIHIVTERIQPLSWSVKRGAVSEETAKWGLNAIATTLRFINGHASSVHGNVRLSSVYTSESGEWKLAGFELLSAISDKDAVIYDYGPLLPGFTEFAPPEILQNNDFHVIQNIPLHSCDAYEYGVLIHEVFNDGQQSRHDLNRANRLPSGMVPSYKKLTLADPKVRLSVAHFLERGQRPGGFFDNALIKLTHDVDQFGLKSEEEKNEFIGRLEELSDDYPQEFLLMKVLPELLKSVEYGGGGPKVFTAVLKLGSKLSEEEYQNRVTPVVVRSFANQDRALRVCLLENLPLMINHLPKKVVTDHIWPPLATGFMDQAPLLRESTVKSILTVITKLSDKIINGDLLKQLAKTANDEQPGIRTNTTICLGKIARHLGSSSRSKVLIAAFARALRDPFVHARNAGLLALGATVDLYSEEECASRILPGLCPLLLDKDKLIRDQANKTLDVFLARVRSHGETMADRAPPDPSAARAETRMATSTDTPSWAGWAISSFTSRVTSAQGEIQSAASPLPPTRPASTPTAAFSKVKATDTGVLTPSTYAQPANMFEAPTPMQLPSLNSAISTLSQENAATPAEEEEDEADFDVWATEDDDWLAPRDSKKDKKDPGLEKQAHEPKPTALPSSASSVSATSFSTPDAAATATVVPVAEPKFEDGGKPDFMGWLAAQNNAKSSKLGKGLLAKSTNSNTNTTATKSPASSVSSSKASSPLLTRKPAAKSSRIVNRPASAQSQTTSSSTTAKPAAVDKKPPPAPSAKDDDDGWDAW